jgi:hypothetical protein
MHSLHRARGKVLFEVLCALSLAASFAGAWDQTGSSALLASASIMALFAIYWSFGLFARDRVDVTAQPTAAVAQPTAVAADAREAEVQTAVQEEVFACEPEVLAEPEPVAARPKKQRARKAQKAAAVVAPVVESPERVANEEPVFDGPPLEQLFDPQPFVRQPRAFGRKERGPRPLPTA